MNRMLRIGLLMLAAAVGSESSAWAQYSYGYVFQIYNDGTSFLYFVDVNSNNDCENFTGGYAWGPEFPEFCPWYDCEGHFENTAAGGRANVAQPRRELTKGLSRPLASNIDAAQLEASLPTSRKWPVAPSGATKKWNPRDSANVVFIGRKVIDIQTDPAKPKIIKEVALFSIYPSVEDYDLKRYKKVGETSTEITAPWENTRRFFALEIASDGTTPDESEATKATPLLKHMNGEFLHQWEFTYRKIQVPVMLVE